VLSSSRGIRLVFLAGLAVWVANELIYLLSGFVLGHDEAEYAISAADMLAGAEPRWYHVSQGMNVVAAPGVLAGGSEIALRCLPFVFSIGFVLAVWQLARRTVGDSTAAWVVAVLAGSRSYVLNGIQLLSDVPAATCLIAATTVITGELGRESGARWRIVVAAPLLSAALYLRYGSCVPIAVIAALAVVFGWRTIACRPAPVIATAVLFMVLFVPHAMMSIRMLGSPFAVLLGNSSVPPRHSMFGGLVAYVTSHPIVFYGILPPPILLAGLFGLRRDRRIAFLWVAAVADIVAIGMITEAHVRYIFFGTALLMILGTDLIRRAIAAQVPRIRRVLGGLVVAAIVTGWVQVTGGSIGYRVGRLANQRAVQMAAVAIRADMRVTHGSICHVNSAWFPELEWYTGCDSGAPVADALARAEPVYIVGPSRADFDPLPGRHRDVLDIPGIVHVIRLDAPR
jgi:hypothetical protein